MTNPNLTEAIRKITDRTIYYEWENQTGYYSRQELDKDIEALITKEVEKERERFRKIIGEDEIRFEKERGLYWLNGLGLEDLPTDHMWLRERTRDELRKELRAELADPVDEGKE